MGQILDMEMHVRGHHSFEHYSSSSENEAYIKKIQACARVEPINLCDFGAVLYQLSSQLFFSLSWLNAKFL